MPLSRGLRQQLAANEDTARSGEFAAMLLAALEDPQIAESVADAVLHAASRRERRTFRTATTSRLSARGRGQRG